jgi:hypothetical protein
MPLTLSNKPQFTGIIILFIGVALLAFTFINAYFFLQEPLGILSTGDLARVFGDALAPLVQGCIRLMYLGIMGWIGSLLTIRGIPLITHTHVPVTAVQAQPTPQPAKHPQPKPQPAPTPKSQPKPIPKTTKPTQPLQPPQPATEQQEPKAVLITPENQKEE